MNSGNSWTKKSENVTQPFAFPGCWARFPVEAWLKVPAA